VFVYNLVVFELERMACNVRIGSCFGYGQLLYKRTVMETFFIIVIALNQYVYTISYCTL